jgi:hypothetical protein
MEVMRFVLTQVLSIHSSGFTGLPLTDKNRPLLRAETGSIRPAILYDKILLGAKGPMGTPAAAKPCLRATGLSIALLSRLSRVLLRRPLSADWLYPSSELLPLAASKAQTLDSHGLAADLAAAAELQLETALQSLRTQPEASDLERMTLLAAAAALHGCRDDTLEDLLRNTKALSAPALADADTLAAALDGVGLYLEASGSADKDSTLTALALEALSRRTFSGLFALDKRGGAPVPLGRQFALMTALLKAYPRIRLDAVLEELFSLFDRLYRTAFQEAAGFLGHPTRSVLRYRGQDLAAVLSSLWALAHLSETGSDQQNHLKGLADTFAQAMTTSFCRHYAAEIHGLFNKTRERTVPANLASRPIIPKYIQCTLPEYAFQWEHRGILRLRDPLALCLVLTESVLERDMDLMRGPGSAPPFPYSAQFAEDADTLLKLLLSLFRSS